MRMLSRSSPHNTKLIKVVGAFSVSAADSASSQDSQENMILPPHLLRESQLHISIMKSSGSWKNS